MTTSSATPSKRTKVISPTMHGFIDYTHAAFFLTTGLSLWKKNRRAAIAALGTSGFILLQALLTDYRLGVKPVISFETHGQMDKGFAAISPVIPKLVGFDDTAEANIFRVNGIAEAGVVALTDFSTSRARAEKHAA